MSFEGWRDMRALVTGASSGIGAALAEALAGAGARLLLTGRNREALAEVAARCGTGASILAGDLTDGEFRKRLAEAVRERLGGLDLLVNNAGISMNARFEELRPEVLRRIMEINFFAPVELTRLLLPELARARGRIVVMSSITGLVGTPTRTAYAASKHALHGFFDALRVELRQRGVSVTIACPGYVATPIRERALLADGSIQGHDQVAGRKMLSAEEVARRTLRAAALRRRRILMGRETRLARLLSLAAPGLLDRILERATR
jgi:short-subunit dehydrogenase